MISFWRAGRKARASSRRSPETSTGTVVQTCSETFHAPFNGIKNRLQASAYVHSHSHMLGHVDTLSGCHRPIIRRMSFLLQPLDPPPEGRLTCDGRRCGRLPNAQGARRPQAATPLAYKANLVAAEIVRGVPAARDTHNTEESGEAGKIETAAERVGSYGDWKGLQVEGAT